MSGTDTSGNGGNVTKKGCGLQMQGIGQKERRERGRKRMIDTKSARSGVVTTETGMSAHNTGEVYEAHNDYIRLPETLQGRMALRPGELATVLGIGRNAAYQLCNRADFPTVRVGHKVIIPMDALRRWLEDQTEVTA